MLRWRAFLAAVAVASLAVVAGGGVVGASFAPAPASTPVSVARRQGSPDRRVAPTLAWVSSPLRRASVASRALPLLALFGAAALAVSLLARPMEAEQPRGLLRRPGSRRQQRGPPAWI